MDAPAKAYVLDVVPHNGYSSCTKCYVVGDWKNRRVCVADCNAQLRTDADFFTPRADDYRRGPCALLSLLQFKPVSCVTLDYMHMVCLGVVRKLFNLLLHGPLKVRLGA